MCAAVLSLLRGAELGVQVAWVTGELGSAGTLGWEKIRLGEEDPPLFLFSATLLLLRAVGEFT